MGAKVRTGVAAIKIGVLVHVRHPQTVQWEKLVWGVPSEDHMGDLPKLVEVLLCRDPSRPVAAIVMGTTLATKEGLLEGEYTKKFLLDHFDDLWSFPRLKHLLDLLSDEQIAALRTTLQGIIVTTPLKRTADEIREAARIFQEKGVREVIQITAASHGPRCAQLQAQARADGLIPPEQLWYMVVSDMCFQDTAPTDTMIIEVPHRDDDPLARFRPTLSQTLKPFFYQLPTGEKQQFIQLAEKFMADHAPEKS